MVLRHFTSRRGRITYAKARVLRVACTALIFNKCVDIFLLTLIRLLYSVDIATSSRMCEPGNYEYRLLEPPLPEASELRTRRRLLEKRRRLHEHFSALLADRREPYSTVL